ncbi:MAG: hypothetical protein M1546_09845 [Chloroflexi bacterium]|nr:hypothetical protein [Chloroflexota bacterium]
MNKLERVRAALAGAEVDRVPASFWFHYTSDKAHGAASVKAHLDYYRASNIDFLKVMNEHPYQANVTIKTPADWRAVRPAPPERQLLPGTTRRGETHRRPVARRVPGHHHPVWPVLLRQQHQRRDGG